MDSQFFLSIDLTRRDYSEKKKGNSNRAPYADHIGITRVYIYIERELDPYE